MRHQKLSKFAILPFLIVAAVSPVQAQTLQADIDYIATELATHIASLEMVWKGVDGVDRGVRLTDASVSCASTKALTVSPVDRAMVLIDWPTTRMTFTGGPETSAQAYPWAAKFSCPERTPCVINRSLDRKLNWKGLFIDRTPEIEFRDVDGEASTQIGSLITLMYKLCALQREKGGRVN